MEFSQHFSVVNCNFPNNIEATFESDENDFDAGFVLESDEDTNAGSENLSLFDWGLQFPC